jgi:hypothetical protein
MDLRGTVMFPENMECEALNCSSPAIKEIRVKVGEKGSVSLFLCEICQLKFKEDKPIE